MQSTELKLSIIVPVFNAEKWLHRCVESLLNQGIDQSEYEILLIDDGSKDGSLAIANDLATANSNIRVFTQPNAGPGAARNRGIDNANGQYLMFVDADDYLKPNSLPPILNLAISNKLDLCFYRLMVLTSKESFIGGGNIIINGICNGEYALRHGTSIGSACTCLFRHNLVQNYSIHFTSICHGEDTLFMTEALAYASKIRYCPEVIYVYDCTSDVSSTDLIERQKLKLIDSIFVSQQTHKLALREGLAPSISKFMRQRANSIIVPQILDVLLHRKKYGSKFTKQYFSESIKLKVFPITGTTLSWRTTILIPVLNMLQVFLSK